MNKPCRTRVSQTDAAAVDLGPIRYMYDEMRRIDPGTMNNQFRLFLIVCVLAAPIAGHAADPSSNAEPLTIVMADNRFEPAHITLHSGQTYQLRLENHGKNLHEFTAPAFLKAATIRDKRLLANGGTDIVVQAGTAVEIFLIAPAKGRYNLICADHDWDGMVGDISVD